MSKSDTRAALFSREERIEHDAIAGLRFLRQGDSEQPLVIFLSGGAHLARIAYGDPSSEHRDFLDYWLAQRGFGLLALSYPTDHPAIGAPLPGLSIKAWSAWVADVTSDVLRDTPTRPVVVAMWSMAGASAAAMNAALASRGLESVCFISLSATPPLPGLIRVKTGGEPLTSDGLWALTASSAPDGIRNDRIQAFLSSIKAQRRQDGRNVIDDNAYLQYYVCNTPIMLRGTGQRYSDSGVAWDLEQAVDDTCAVRFPDFPLTAMIVPTDREDEAHALGDRVNWHFFNVQKIRAEAQGVDMSMDRWERLRSSVTSLPSRLHREIPGGHFFFVGAKGAEHTVAHIADLIAEARSVRAEINAILRCQEASSVE